MAIPGQAPDPAEEAIPPADALLSDPAFAAEVVQPETPTGEPPVPPEGPLTPEPTEIEQRLAQAERRLQGRIEALADRGAQIAKLQAENAELRARGVQEPPEDLEPEPLPPPRDERGRYQPTPLADPALRDLPRDEDGNVLVGGAYWPPQTALLLLSGQTATREAQEARQQLRSHIEAEQQAAEHAQTIEEVDSIFDAYRGVVAETAAKELPYLAYLSDEAREAEVDDVFAKACDRISRDLKKYPDDQQLGQLTNERLTRALTEEVTKRRDQSVAVVEAQLKHNAEYRDTQKAPPIGGTPGTPKPPGPETMTRAQRSAYMDQLARETERALQNPT